MVTALLCLAWRDGPADDPPAEEARGPAAAVCELDPRRVAVELGLGHDGEVLPHCLLYTSPSLRDQRGSRIPSSATKQKSH